MKFLLVTLAVSLVVVFAYLFLSSARVAASNQARTAPKQYSDKELRARLTSLQYRVTRQDGTEPPFRNEYWDNKKEGIYVDVISGKALFASVHKYKSGTGWPSFYQPLDKNEVVERQDRKLFVIRTEVRSKTSDAHLGHLFQDGPKPTGLRYCINSAALRFVPKEALEAEGLGEYLSLFK